MSGDRLRAILRQVRSLAAREGKKTGFFIGNTRKLDRAGPYFTPIRNTSALVAGSVMVYSEKQAGRIAFRIDGKVDYILVDSEKKIGREMYGTNDHGNIERGVREVVKASTILTFKGNDVTVDAIDCLLVQFVGDPLRGIGAKKVAIIGAGNLGSKLALRLVERGAHVVMTRRNRTKLQSIVRALNYIKPRETEARIAGEMDPAKAARGANILIGLSNGAPVVTASMIEGLAPRAIVLDGGKGCLFPEAVHRAEELQLPVLRVDVRAAVEGQVAMLLKMEQLLKGGLGRREFPGVGLVSSGLLGRQGEVVVDHVVHPRAVLGVADGKGELIRSLRPSESRRIRAMERLIRARGAQ